MQCLKCGEAELIQGNVTLQGERQGELFDVSLRGWKCPSCNYQTVDSKQSAGFTKLVSDAYRRAHRLLTGREIKALRRRMKMTQKQFAEHVGVGVASLKRWELGQVQERAMDQLMRLKTDPQAARQNLEAINSQQRSYIVEAEIPYDWVPGIALADPPYCDFVWGDLGVAA